MRMNLFGIIKLYDDNEYLQEIIDLPSVEKRLLLLRKSRRLLVWFTVIILFTLLSIMIGSDILQLIGIIASISLLENLPDINLDNYYWGVFLVFLFSFAVINSEIHLIMIRELNMREKQKSL